MFQESRVTHSVVFATLANILVILKIFTHAGAGEKWVKTRVLKILKWQKFTSAIPRFTQQCAIKFIIEYCC